MRRGTLMGILFLTLAASTPLAGVGTSFWQVGSFDEFLEGTLTNISLNKDGSLRLAPHARVIFNPEEALALSLARDRNGNLYVGTGHQGKVFRVDPQQKASLFFTAQEPAIFALAEGPDNAIYVGSSPEGKVYRVTPDGKSQVFYDPKTKYIWAMAFDKEGHLYVATGDKGQIFRVDTSGKGNIFFDSRQTHIMCLTFDRNGNLLAGSVPNGLVYRITPEGKPFVLYQAPLPEVHALATDDQGHIFAAALGSVTGKTSPEFLVPPTPGVPVPGTVTTVTVTASEEISSKQGQKGQHPPPSEVPATSPSFNRTTPVTPTVPTFRIPQGRGALIEIHPDDTADTIWSSNNESVFGLAVRGHKVLFSTDANGRIFELDPTRDGERLTLLTETRESLATRLLVDGSDLYVTTSNIAKLFQIEAPLTREGIYESPVKDTKLISKWGVLAWRGEVPAGTTLEFFTRSGNSDRPDNTWTDWMGPYRSAAGNPIVNPPARYVQWKAAFHGSGASTAVLNEVTFSYLNQNLAPQIRSLTVSTTGERTGPAGATTTSAISTGMTVTVTPTPTAGFMSPSPVGAVPPKTPVILTWQADDPNGDQLLYTLYVRATDEQEWHLLKDKLRQTTYAIEPSALSDGKYVARLVASDEESNPPPLARRTELLSAPFWVDNTPPQIEVLMRTAVAAGGAEVRFQASDLTSPLRSAETSCDSMEWRDVLSDDGIVDSQKETFTVKLPGLTAGEHIVSLRAFDTAGNVGVGKAVVHVPAANRER